MLLINFYNSFIFIKYSFSYYLCFIIFIIFMFIKKSTIIYNTIIICEYLYKKTRMIKKYKIKKYLKSLKNKLIEKLEWMKNL